jgi:AraC-like DNA-binding protein
LIRLGVINKLKPIHFIHFIPAVIHLISISQYFFIPWGEKINIVQSIYDNPTVQENLNVNLFFTAKFNYAFRMIHFVFYCIISLSVIMKSFKTQSPNEKNLLKSLQKITIIFLLLTLCYSIHILFILVRKSYTDNIIQIILLIDIGLLFILVYELFKYPELFFNTHKFKQSYLETSPFLNRKKNNTLIPEVIYNDIDQKINALKIERSFLINPTTSFEVFANEINQSKFHIRSYLKLNNSSFVILKNEARVNEAIKYLESKKKYKMDYIAKMSGFNTRSNFFKIFKNITGRTPSQYEKGKS